MLGSSHPNSVYSKVRKNDFVVLDTILPASSCAILDPSFIALCAIIPYDICVLQFGSSECTKYIISKVFRSNGDLSLRIAFILDQALDVISSI